ncbi:MAG TPA: decaprenylphospho-beta-D-erythro-pentofuranosid-2-ulose 2-reductase [Ilumatobacteraceae bacterium]|nr:decaprenylphospho-beta-D-erythro-pentofuranosid-2-ulose 2-reductase [Ilumatobacteraceae bacterium]
MRNALDEPQTIVVLGGTSDIGLAIAAALSGPATRHVVLACRDVDTGTAAAAALDIGPAEASVVAFEATDTASHAGLVDDLAERFGDLDVVVLAFGVLGSQATFEADPAAAAAAVTANYSGAVSVGLAVANRLRTQGHGRLVVLSSVAGERVRKANFVYGSSKAGLDAFAQGLGDSLAGSGASVLVVRPGWVASSMTAGLDPAPMATTPEAVAAAVVKALRAGRRTIWVPGTLRLVFAVFRHLPGPVWRRMPIR